MRIRVLKLFCSLAAVFLAGCNKDPVGDIKDPYGNAIAPKQLLLLQLYPSTTAAGQPFHVIGGMSTLALACKGGSPQTAIVFNSKTLKSAFSAGSDGNACSMSAYIPAELYSTPGTYSVYIKNSVGESNRKDFTVTAAGHP